jgi:hypothetical protein
MTDQITLAVLTAIGFAVFLLVLGVLSRAGGRTAAPVADGHRIEQRRMPSDQRFCIFCRGPLDWDGTTWQMHPACKNWGTCSQCGYELMTSSRQDLFTHFCPPRIAAQNLLVEREMERQRREQP